MDIERFQHQKVVHLKEILAAYCVLQFKLARKVDNLIKSITLFTRFTSRVDFCDDYIMFFIGTGSPSLAAHQRLSRKYAVNMFMAKQTVTEQ